MTIQHELIPMRPGDVLRHEREQKGLTLEQAASRSRIKPSVIAAIESGETSTIPSVYLKGYLRQYARFLDIERADVEQWLQDTRGAQPEVRTVFAVEGGRGRAEKWLKASSYMAASVLIAVLAWQVTHEAVRFSQGDGGQEPAATETGSAESAVSTPDRPANTHLNASIASVEVLRERGELDSEAAAETAWAAVGDDPEGGEPGTGWHRLSIDTSADTWIEIVDGQGENIEMDLIRAGTRRDYSGQGPFRVMIGRASAVRFSMDGEPVDLSPHTRGNVARLILAGEPGTEPGEPAKAPEG
jgi:cytoskeleton protein RodZ